MKDKQKEMEIKHKKPYGNEGKENPVTMNGDSNRQKPVRGLK